MGRGRRTKLTEAIQQRICDDIRLGLPMRVATAGVGVSESAVWRWLQSPAKQYQEFRKAIAAARRERMAMLLATVVKATRDQRDKNNKLIREGDPHIALKLLEKVEPVDFGQQVRVHLEAELTAATTRLQQEFSREPETLRRALVALIGEGSAHSPGLAPVEVEDEA